MKCLITGAAGFIGSHLCERLIAEGHQVHGLDNFSTGKEETLDAITNKNFSYSDVDISNTPCATYFKGVDWVFHLAAKADVVPSIERPYLYHDTNVTGTIRMLEYAKEANVKRFIYAASSSCYGIPDQYPTPETAPCKPMYPYALTKYLGEQYVLHWAKVYKLPALSLRLFNVYGPRARTSGSYGAVFGVFLSQLANKAPLTVIGDGSQSRDFTYVTDVVEAFIKSAESDISGKVINIGSGESKSINDLIKYLDHPSTITIPDRPGEPRITQADRTKAYLNLGWVPKVSFKDGVQIMKEHINDYKDAPLWSPEKIEKATESWFKYLGG